MCDSYKDNIIWPLSGNINNVTLTKGTVFTVLRYFHISYYVLFFLPLSVFQVLIKHLYSF